jgi:DnaA family protein
MQQLPLAMRLRERATFAAFIAGANERAIARLRAVSAPKSVSAAASDDVPVATAGLSHAVVVWLSGARGVGKSHLLQACCAEAASGGQRVIYLPLSQLLSLGASALEEWQGAQLLALDELDAVIGERDWERALFALYRDAEERGATVIAAAERPPQELRFALPDLQSRFAAALLLPLQPLDDAGQRAALQLRARARGLELPDETAAFLQRRFRRELPVLCDLLDALDEAALQAQRRLTVPFIRQVLAAQLAPRAE